MPLPSWQEICTKWPLYGECAITKDDTSDLHNLFNEKGSIDLYCVACKTESVFHKQHREYEWSVFNSSDRVPSGRIGHHHFGFVCARAIGVHYVDVILYVTRDRLLKIGQMPSIADLNEPFSRKYSKVLPKDAYHELGKAVGLASHGVGIGSFVYLRRIFERLIEEAKGKASKEPGWNEEAFKNIRMDEKIELLKHHLPPFLVEERKLYGILSKGIHSLSESECLEAFEPVRFAIELILDEKLAELERVEKVKAAKAKLAAIANPPAPQAKA